MSAIMSAARRRRIQRITPVPGYGALYNGYVITDIRGLAPVGYHVATQADYDQLISFLGGNSIAGGKMKETGTTHWLGETPGTTNSSKFSGVGAGIRGSGYRYSGSFMPVGYNNWLWTSTINNTGLLAYRLSVTNLTTQFMGVFEKFLGMSVRYVKDSTILTDGQEGTMVGNDLREYATVCIGTDVPQEWTKVNVRETKFANGDLIPVVINDDEWAALTTPAMCSYLNTNGFL